MAINLLIVDDSALMRRHLTQIFAAAGGFEIRAARNGQEAIDENLAWQPDVITLDINMPVMDGITALAHIMASRPAPVVMVSSLTEKGALATFEALALGAADYIAKPGGTISLSIDEIQEELIAKVKAAARAKIKNKGGTKGLAERLREARAKKPPRPAFVRRNVAQAEVLVLIGVSTGGPSTLEEILPKLPADFPFPIIVAQHMPASFTGPFAARMNGLCVLEVVEVNKPLELAPGTIYVGKGGADVVIANRAGRLMVLPKPESPRHLWHPSVEILGRSALECCDAGHLIAVMLTGMGDDGADAFAEIKKQGGRTIAEAEDSAVVFGMPKELIARDGANLMLPADKIANQLIAWART
ncbi:chemotaxis-specific protein-glutamate methyltransferase CheB [Burkholderia multivorans]|uniref:chemotaxis-specific protein-glutamate methyltransferase CheB n=1 Tax=Burkholderia multivorans TaxID=87883 RepID=UPI00286465EF|nr:chemotaxis-specific protein-glutamate methyltransferase CheB [Burkholderia multivorans]MDR9096153.1 Chemotaxis response regulator protein-glutamate methylesterase [Burkholderia multivorans]MDR9119926.1 Chemotaxis response regulator protein-glutamate methylesterase [Burkholderia multivorans]MDR9160193.1 Chemotaxis response regulator protein-glutamate methylesterase [Burkholderia multivorans]MDR9166740.1 Chemotaxis response regulator protein-glutamate methylesterase [Burkholderia multivorans]